MNLAGDVGRSKRSLLDRIGIHAPFFLGYLGLLIFMIGDGVESGYLSPYLTRLGISVTRVAAIFTAYGLTAAISAWLSGALSDLWGPRRVMWLGLSIWVVFQILFLKVAVPSGDWRIILAVYALRGFGYPLFAFGFLVWLTAGVPPARLGTAVGWFWFAFTGGLPTLGSLLASVSIPRIGEFQTLWLALALVIVGGLIALLGIRDQTGRHRLVRDDEHPLLTLIRSVSIAWKEPKTAIGCVVRIINTAPQFGFLVFLPIYFTKTIGFSQERWLHLLSMIFVSNIGWNLLFGIIGDRFGWRRTVVYCGGVGSAITTLLLYYTPHLLGADYYPLIALSGILYGATLAGYVPLSALMPSLAPEHKGAAMSMLNLGAGASVWVGPAIVGLFLPTVGVAGVMWIFAGLYLISAMLAMFLTLPDEAQIVPPAKLPAVELPPTSNT